MKSLKFVLICFFCFNHIIAQELNFSTSLKAKEILEMNLDQAFESIAKLNKEQTLTLINQIRVEAKKDYPNIEKFYLLISHLEAIKAIEEEEKKLRDLNLVYLLGLILLIGVLLYTIYSQRKALESIRQYTQE